jgi:hypothetical protein
MIADERIFSKPIRGLNSKRAYPIGGLKKLIFNHDEVIVEHRIPLSRIVGRMLHKG